MKLQKKSSLVGFVWTSYLVCTAYGVNPGFAIVTAVIFNVLSLAVLYRIDSVEKKLRLREPVSPRAQKLLPPGNLTKLPRMS